MKINYIYKVYWKKMLKFVFLLNIIQLQCKLSNYSFQHKLLFPPQTLSPPHPPPNQSKNFVSSFACSSILFNSIPQLFRPLILPSIPCVRDRPQTLSFLFIIEAGPNIIFSILLCPLQNFTPSPFNPSPYISLARL